MVAVETYPGDGKPMVNEDNELVGIYTQGKVGSKSLVAALQTMYPDQHVWDTRRGLMEGVLEHERIRGTRPRLLSEDREFAEFLLKQSGVKMSLVSAVREPVAIAVSSLFYNFIPRNPDVDINEVADEEFAARLQRGESFSSPSFHLDWFDIEVKPLTGIDVYADGPFPTETGYRVYGGDMEDRHTDLLVMRLEDLGRIGTSALSEFTGKEAPAELPRINTGDDTEYAARYDAFKREARLPEEWVMWQLNSQFARHFYTDQEREGFAARWIG